MKKIMMYKKLNAIKWSVLFTFLLLGLSLTSISKTRIYYVAGSTSKASPSQKEILDKISDELKTGLGELWIGKMNFMTWNDFDSKKSLLQEQPTDYVLMMDSWRENEAKGSFEMKFKLMSVKDGYNTESIWWMNNDYRFNLYDGQPIDLEKFVTALCTDIDLYLKSSDDPDKRLFRPRIKIEPFDMDLADVDNGDFIKWLNEELNSKYAVGEQKYVFYYSSKKSKIYPETSIYKITGTIKKSADSGGNLMKVDFMIEFGPKGESELAVELSKDYKNDKTRKKVLVENFDQTLNEEIQYYER